MKNYILLLIIIFLAFNSCNKNQVYTDLLEVPYLNEHFSEDEIKDLSKIIDQFETRLQEKSESKEIEKVYSDFCTSLQDIRMIAEFSNIIKSYIPDSSDIYQEISEEVFNKIWKFENGFINNNPDDIIKLLLLRFDGEYANFLKEFSQKNPLLKEYAESLEGSGDLNPSMVAIFQRRWEELDLSDAGIRLIVAVHYFSMADGEIVYKNHHE